MPRIIITVLIITFLAKITFGQRQAFIHINEEKDYPNDEYTKIAGKQYSWTVNGKTIHYKTGKYSVPVNKPDEFDTIRFQNIFKRTNLTYGNFVRKIKHPVYDTTTIIMLCKFRENHNYRLGQLFPGDFVMYSLDTFETRKTVTLRVVNKKNTDTLYFVSGYKEYDLFSDTVMTISDANEKIDRNFVDHFELNASKKESLFVRDGPGIPRNTIFELSYQYFHADKLEIEFDCATKKYKLKLLR